MRDNWLKSEQEVARLEQAGISGNVIGTHYSWVQLFTSINCKESDMYLFRFLGGEKRQKKGENRPTCFFYFGLFSCIFVIYKLMLYFINHLKVSGTGGNIFLFLSDPETNLDCFNISPYMEYLNYVNKFHSHSIFKMF